MHWLRLSGLGLWLGNQGGAMTGASTLLGPYPCEEVTVTGVDDTTGWERSTVVRRAIK